MPLGMGADGAPGAMLPDGHFVFLANTVPSTGPTRMFDYHYADGSLTDITATLPPNLQFRLNSVAANSFRMLILPNGSMLMSTGAGSTTIYEYKPSGVPLDSWRPVIYDIYRSTPTQLILEGYNLTGISEGATYGSDARMSSNYPIVKLSQVGVVKYARTTNWTSGISRPNSFNYDSATVDIPVGLNPGTYYVNVIANGIQSYGTTIQLAPSRVAAYYKDGLLNINGDDQPNNVSLTYKQVKVSGVLKSASVTVTANDTFTLVNGKQSVTFDVALDRIRVNAIMGAGDDTISFSSFFAKTILLNLGDGDDTATLFYNSVDNTLALDGGTGFDTVTLSGNSVNKTTSVNIP